MKAKVARVIGVVVAVTIILTAIIALAVFVPWYQAAHIVDDATRLEREDNARRTILQAIGGVVVLAGIFIAWRRLEVIQEGQVTERFSRAIEHLGDDSLDVRLGAIYALERIARDSRQDHGPVMEILTAYVREHAPWKPPSEDQQPADDGPRFGPPSPMENVQAVNDILTEHVHTIETDIQAALTVIGRRKTDYDPPEQRIDLINTGLRRANLAGANLRKAILAGANMKLADLKGAKLQDADLRMAVLHVADLRKAQLQGADLLFAQLQVTHLNEADLRGANLDDARLHKAFLVGTDLRGAHLVGAKLEGANFTRANLRGAILWQADLQRTIFWQADLRGADLKAAKLQGAKLSGADLREADFNGADMQRADFSSADLRGADFSGADLQGANLTGVDLSEATGLSSQQLELTKGNEDTRLPPGVERPGYWPAQREDSE